MFSPSSQAWLPTQPDPETPSQVCLPTQLETPPKRRRLQRKSDPCLFPPCAPYTPPRVAPVAEAEEEPEEAGKPEDFKNLESEQWWAARDEHQRYVICYGRLGRHYVRFQTRYQELRRKRIAWPKSWAKLTTDFRRRLIDDVVAVYSTKVCKVMLEWMVTTQVRRGAKDGQNKSVRNPNSCCLLIHVTNCCCQMTLNVFFLLMSMRLWLLCLRLISRHPCGNP